MKKFNKQNYDELDKVQFDNSIIVLTHCNNFYMLKKVEPIKNLYAFINIFDNYFFNNMFEDRLEMCEEIIELLDVEIIIFNSHFEFVEWLYKNICD
jgi:hypothetical protein